MKLNCLKVMPQLPLYSTAVKRYHDQGNSYLKKSYLTEGLLTALKAQGMNIMVRVRQTSHWSSGNEPYVLHPD